SVTDFISQISVHSGDALVNYDFCEMLPVSISGLVWLDTTRNCEIDDGEARLGGVTIQLLNSTGAVVAATHTAGAGTYKLDNPRSDDQRIAGVTLELRYTLTGEPVRGEDLLPGTYPPGPVRTVTDASGFYQFIGLPQGNYSVFEAQPNGYIDSRDTPGTTGGL